MILIADILGQLSRAASDKIIGVNSTAFGRKLTLFRAIRFPAFHLKYPAFFWRISIWKKMRSMHSAQRKMELRRLGNQLPCSAKMIRSVKLLNCVCHGLNLPMN